MIDFSKLDSAAIQKLTKDIKNIIDQYSGATPIKSPAPVKPTPAAANATPAGGSIDEVMATIEAFKQALRLAEQQEAIQLGEAASLASGQRMNKTAQAADLQKRGADVMADLSRKLAGVQAVEMLPYIPVQDQMLTKGLQAQIHDLKDRLEKASH